MSKKTTEQTATVLEIAEIQRGHIQVFLKGTSPLVCNRMSQKVWRELLLPAKKKNRTEKESSLKHDPMAEFRASPYTLPDESAPTLIALPGAAFKRALASAAIDLGGTKSQIGRLSWVVEELVPIYGVPQLWMAITRQRDMARTPDVRTRAILPQWACTFTIQYVKPILRENELAQLLAGAGEYIGVGDGRPEKGALAYGRFQMISATDATYAHLVKHGGRAAQQAALRDPEAYDVETADMLQWFTSEAKRRELKPSAAASETNGEDAEA